MIQSHMLGDFLVRNEVVTPEQLVQALQFQKESMKVMNLFDVMDGEMKQEDVDKIIHRQAETGETLEQAAVSLGYISQRELDEKFRDDKKHRIPLGEILVRQGAADFETMEEWVGHFENQVFDGSDQLAILRKVHLFKELDDERLQGITDRLHFKQYEAGDIIFRENDSSDAIFVIETGLVRMSLRTDEGLHELGKFTSEMHFGLAGILDGRPRGQRAEAVMRSRLWRLEREDFRDIMRKHPEVSFAALSHMSQGITNIFRTIKGDASALETNIVTVFVDDSSERCLALARAITKSMWKEHRRPLQVLYSIPALDLPLHGSPEEFGVETRSVREDDFFCLYNKGLAETRDGEFVVKYLHAESRRIDSLVVMVSTDSSPILKNMLLKNSARTVVLLEDRTPAELLASLKPGQDRLYFFSGAKGMDRRAEELSEHLSEHARSFMPQFISDSAVPLSSAQTAKWYETGSEETMKIAGRLTRWLEGRTLGIAFGGGGARIMAHIGLLEELENMGVVVDETAGTSGGSVVAGMLAQGMSGRAIGDYLLKHAVDNPRNPLIDLTIPIKSIAAGKRFKKLLKGVYGERRVFATEIPYFPVTSDMETGREYIPRLCPMWQASKASAAIPGFHPIVKLNGRLLGDGGLINNVPASVLREFGTRTVISSNITADPAQGSVNPNRLLSAIGQMVDIMLFQSVESHQKYSDLDIKPNVDGYATADFSVGRELLDLGRKEAQRRGRDIKVLIDKLEQQGF